MLCLQRVFFIINCDADRVNRVRKKDRKKMCAIWDLKEHMHHYRRTNRMSTIDANAIVMIMSTLPKTYTLYFIYLTICLILRNYSDNPKSISFNTTHHSDNIYENIFSCRMCVLIAN